MPRGRSWGGRKTGASGKWRWRGRGEGEKRAPGNKPCSEQFSRRPWGAPLIGRKINWISERPKNNARLQALNHMTAVERDFEIRCKKKKIVTEEFLGVWIKTDETQTKNVVDCCCVCGVEFTGRERKEQKEGDGRLGHIFEAVDATARKHGVRRQFVVQVPHKSKREAGHPTASKHGSECHNYVPTNKEVVWLFNAFARLLPWVDSAKTSSPLSHSWRLTFTPASTLPHSGTVVNLTQYHSKCNWRFMLQYKITGSDTLANGLLVDAIYGRSLIGRKINLLFDTQSAARLKGGGWTALNRVCSQGLFSPLLLFSPPPPPPPSFSARPSFPPAPRSAPGHLRMVEA